MKNTKSWINIFHALTARKTIKTFLRSFIFMLPLGFFIIAGCGQDNVITNSTQNQTAPLGNQVSTYDLIAGQNILVGNVEVWNDSTNLYVDYNITEAGWCLTETHMHAAVTLGEIPQTRKGNPIPGQFTYKHEGLNCALTDSYVIPLTDIDPNWNCDDTLFIATHAAVVLKDTNSNIIQSETAWGNGPGFPGNNWAMYFNYTITCDDPPPTGCQEETAWGGNSAGGGNAWWYYFDTQGPATQTIYAGQNPTDGTVTYNAGDGTLTINLGSWELQNDSEAVKVQGYDVIPLSRPAAGLFTIYKGTALTVSGNGSRYYAIHLDVQLCP